MSIDALPPYRMHLMTPSMVEEAIGLAETFRENTDDLSLRSIRWIVETAEEGEQMEPEARDAYLARRVHVLVTQILVDMMYRPLIDPVMDQDGYVWSRACYESYKVNFGISPLTMQPFSAVVPHSFAERLIALVKPLLPRVPEGVLIVAPQTPLEEMQDYAILVNSRAAMQDRMMARRIQETLSRVDTLETELERRSARAKEKAERDAAMRTAQVRQNIGAAVARHREANEPLRTGVREGEKQIVLTQAELNARKIESRDLSNANVSLSNEVCALQKKKEEITNPHNGPGGWCTML